MNAVLFLEPIVSINLLLLVIALAISTVFIVTMPAIFLLLYVLLVRLLHSDAMNVFVLGQTYLHLSIVCGLGQRADSKDGNLQIYDIRPILDHLLHVFVAVLNVVFIVLLRRALNQVEAGQNFALKPAFAIDDIVVLRPLVKCALERANWHEELTDHLLVLALVDTFFNRIKLHAHV